MFWANSDQLNFLTPLAPLGMYNHFHLSLFHSFSLFHFLPLTFFFLPLSLFASRILTNENISPLLAVILEPQIHLITMHYPLGTLFHILHDMEAGTHPQTHTHTHTHTHLHTRDWDRSGRMRMRDCVSKIDYVANKCLSSLQLSSPSACTSLSTPLEVRINLQEGVKLAKDICHGMRQIHSIEPIVNRFHLNPHNIVVSWYSTLYYYKQ